jgi:cell division protein FtsN
MSKLDLLTISIVIVCLAALGYLVYKIVDLMNPPSAPTSSIQDTYVEPATTTADSTYTNWDNEANTTSSDADLDDDQVGQSLSDENSSTPSGKSSYADEEMDNSSSGIAETSTSSSTKAANSQTATAYDRTPATGSLGKYMVLAGSYRQRVNANNQAARLRKLGYSSAEVKIFDKGTYAVVLVDRFSNYNDAKKLVTELAGKGVDAMVKE